MNDLEAITLSGAALARIIIVAYKSNDVILTCLSALETQTDKRFEVVIVDNGAPNHSLMTLPNFSFPVQIVTPMANLGFAEGCNAGAKDAQTPWLIMLNPDTQALPEWFERLSASMAKRPETDVWASTLIRQDNPQKLDGFGDVMSIFGVAWRGGYNQPAADAPQKDVVIFGPCGAAAAYRRAAFEEVGGFDPAYFCYLEDVDLALRLTLSKYTARISHQARVLHVGGGSSQQGSDFAMMQTYKNNLYLLVKNFPLWLLLFSAPLYAALQIWVIFRNRKDPLNQARKTGRKLGYKRLGEAWRARKAVIRKSGYSQFLWARLCKNYGKFRGQSIFYLDE